jgi:acyl-CoA thioesterase FadM
MARVKIDLPQQFVFSTTLSVRMGDLVSGLHLGNHVLISYLNEVYQRFLDEYKLVEAQPSGGVSMINADLAIRYLSEAHYGDVLKIDLALGELSRCGVDLYFKVTNQRTGRDTAVAKMAMLFFDYHNRQPVNVPEKLKSFSARSA